jgi:hypothetical protein
MFHHQLASQQKTLVIIRLNCKAEKILEGYLLTLHNTLEGHKDFKQLESKLTNRRLDLDAKLNKMHKSKKEDPVLEEETRVCQEKYEQTLQVITDKMIELNSLDVNEY